MMYYRETGLNRKQDVIPRLLTEPNRVWNPVRVEGLKIIRGLRAKRSEDPQWQVLSGMVGQAHSRQVKATNA